MQRGPTTHLVFGIYWRRAIPLTVVKFAGLALERALLLILALLFTRLIVQGNRLRVVSRLPCRQLNVLYPSFSGGSNMDAVSIVILAVLTISALTVAGASVACVMVSGSRH